MIKVMDNMVIKSNTLLKYIRNVLKAFDILDKEMIKLNLEECTFDVKLDKFLGYIVFKREIKANLDKIRMIIEIEIP